MSKLDVRDDYAVLDTKIGRFYYGWETARDEDDDYEWRFEFTDASGDCVCSITKADIGADAYSYDEAGDVLLCGIGYCIDQGWIKAADI